MNCGAGVLVQTTTTRSPAHRLIAAGLVPSTVGLIVRIASAWTSPAGPALFLIGGAVMGLGGGAMTRCSLSVVISTTGAANRAGAPRPTSRRAMSGVSLPIVGLGLALQQPSPRVTPLIFAALIGIGCPAAAAILARRKPGCPQARSTARVAAQRVDHARYPTPGGGATVAGEAGELQMLSFRRLVRAGPGPRRARCDS